jgi:hypothetical protein
MSAARPSAVTAKSRGDGANADEATLGTKPNKKPYAAPELIRWGTLREITSKIGVKGALDGGKPKLNKTRP